MSYRSAVLFAVLVVFLVPITTTTPTADAQVNYGNSMGTGAWSGGYSFGPCSWYPRTYRYVLGGGLVTPASNAQSLVVAINMSLGDPDLISLPSSVIVVGNPSGQDAPHGIPPYRGGNCWWFGSPKFADAESSELINSIIYAPGNPVPPGTGVWRAFEIPLTDEVLEEGWVQTFFNLKHNGTGGQVLQAVNGMASAVIPAPGPTAVAAALQPPDTNWVFCPGNAWYDITPMHFTQMPDTNGTDVDFTYPSVMVDDFVATEDFSVQQLKFWFSAEGDWFDPVLNLSDISNIRVGFSIAAPDSGDDFPIFFDFDPASPDVAITEYTVGLRDWCSPADSVFTPGDHTKIYEATIDFPAESYFDCYADSLYYVGISIATDDSCTPTLKLGWASADRNRYPPGYAGRSFESGPFGFYMACSINDDLNLNDSFMDTYCFLNSGGDMAFVLNHVIVPGDDPVCGNDVWEETEFCGRDCWNDRGYVEMNHDCKTNLIDFLIFAEHYGEVGANNPADFNKDNIVNLTDFSIFATKYGLTVPLCNDVGTPRPTCQGSIALSADSSVTSDTATLPLGPNVAYVIVDDWDDARVLQYAIEASPNIFILNHYAIVSVSPASVSCDPTPQQSFRTFADPGGSWTTGRTVVAKIEFMITAPGAAWMQITEVSGCPGERIMWSKSSTDRLRDFLHVSNLGINGGTVPVTQTTCTVVGVDGDNTPVAHKLGQNYPNPFNPATAIPYQIAKPAHVSLTIYNVRGERVRTLVDQRKPEGWYVADWDGTNARGERVASGIYFYRMRAGSFVQTRKLVLLK